MPSNRLFIDSASKLFIALAQINMDTFYQHLFIIAERRYPVTLYEQLVVELTNRSFSLQAAYRSSGTPYELSDREPEPYDQQIKDFARMIEEADCVLVGGASGLSAAGGGDFYYEDNVTYRRHFGKFAERYGFRALLKGRPTAGPPPSRAGATLPPSSTPRSTPRCASPTKLSTPFLPRKTSSFSPPTRTRSS